MKRINVDIDDRLMNEAMRMSGMKTKKELVNAALDYYKKQLLREEAKLKKSK
jgi:Arc/MetJ family transcription regulator